MASLSIDSNGNATIQITTVDGRRFPVRIGKVGRQRAERIKDHVGELELTRRGGIEPSAATRTWLADVKGPLRSRLVRAGLCDPDKQRDLTLGGLTEQWQALKQKTVKPQTLVRLKQGPATLIEHFGADRRIDSINAGDADEWRAWALGSRDRRLSEATLRKRTSDARDLFGFALRKGFISGQNPFDHLPAASIANIDRRRYIDEQTAHRVMDALQGAGTVPTWELRLLFALGRWCGMRLKSEPMALRWSDIHFDTGRIRVDSSKTGVRYCPMFPELRPLLMDAFDHASEGQAHVMPSLQRLSSMALRKHVEAGIRRAGLEPWPKLFINLRSSRETDLAQNFPLHNVVAWIGNSEAVAQKHYLQTTDGAFERAAEWTSGKAVRIPVQSGDEMLCKADTEPRFQGNKGQSSASKNTKVTPTGFEPVLPG